MQNAILGRAVFPRTVCRRIHTGTRRFLPLILGAFSWALTRAGADDLLFVRPENTTNHLYSAGLPNGVKNHPVRRGYFLSATTTRTNQWGSTGWTTGPRADGYHIEWKLQPNLGRRLQLERARFALLRSGGTAAENGPADWQLAWSLDNFATPGAALWSTNVPFSDVWRVIAATNISLATVPVIEDSQTLAFRLYGSGAGASGAAGLWTDSPLVVEGAVVKELLHYNPSNTAQQISDQAYADQVLSGNLRRGAGLFASTAVSNQWGSTGWPVYATGDDDYLEASLTALDGRLRMDALDFTLARTSGDENTAGPASWFLRWQIAGVTAWSNLWIRTVALNGPTTLADTIDLSALQPLEPGQTALFRWYGYTSGTNGTAGFAAGIPVSLRGDVHRVLARFEPEVTTNDLVDTAATPGVRVTPMHREGGLAATTAYQGIWGSTGWAGGVHDKAGFEVTAIDGPVSFDAISFRFGRQTWTPGDSGELHASLHAFRIRYPVLDLWEWHATLPGGDESAAVTNLDLSAVPDLQPGDTIWFYWTADQTSLSGGMGFFRSDDVVLTGRARNRLRIVDLQPHGMEFDMLVAGERGSRFMMQNSINLTSWSSSVTGDVLRFSNYPVHLPSSPAGIPYFYRLREE